MDILKHGESAYPADAWVEAQYMKDGGLAANLLTKSPTKSTSSKSKDGLPPNMKFSRTASYNDPDQMFPLASKLFSG